MTWIFAYGSLVSPTSLAATIGRSISVGAGMHVAELAGFRRAWNYGSAVLRGDWTAEDGTDVVGGLVVSLGIVEEPGTSINGVVFAVDDAELADLDWRERAYDRVDVTGRITLLDQSVHVELDEPIAVYVPQRVAIERYERHRDDGTAGVRRSYWELVDAAFADLGPRHSEWYRTTPQPDVPVVDIILDPLPARRPRAR
jgi:cation transport regulator ChaC